MPVHPTQSLLPPMKKKVYTHCSAMQRQHHKHKRGRAKVKRRTPNKSKLHNEPCFRVLSVKEKKRRAVDHLNNNQLLNLIPLAPLHPVPRRVCQRATHSPHDGDRGLEGICSSLLGPHLLQSDHRQAGRVTHTGLLNLAGHLDDARRAAGRRGRVETDEGARSAGGDAGEHCACVCVYVELL